MLNLLFELRLIKKVLLEEIYNGIVEAQRFGRCQLFSLRFTRDVFLSD